MSQIVDISFHQELKIVKISFCNNMMFVNTLFCVVCVCICFVFSVPYVIMSVFLIYKKNCLNKPTHNFIKRLYQIS